MPDYVFIDGPLAGQETSLDQLPAGVMVVMEVLDLFEDTMTPPTFQYVIEDEASPIESGRLRFAADVSASHAGAA